MSREAKRIIKGIFTAVLRSKEIPGLGTVIIEHYSVISVAPNGIASVRVKRTSLCIRERRRASCCMMDDRSDARSCSFP